MITQDAVLDIARDTIFNIVIVAAPLLLVSLIIGLIISIFQTVTSIQEQTLTFVPKILAVFITLLLALSGFSVSYWYMIKEPITNNCVEYMAPAIFALAGMSAAGN